MEKNLAVASRPEVELLLCCARTCMDAEKAECVKVLLRKAIDWSHLLQLADLHRVMPLLYRILGAVCPEAVPKAFMDQLRRHFLVNVGWNHFLTNELIRLLQVLKMHEIPAITFKGPLLAAAVYGSLALRQFGDLDILIRQRDVEQAHTLLRNEGYQLVANFTWQYHFVHPRHHVNVDLHQIMTPPYFVTTSLLDFERLWQRMQPVSLGGQTVGNLSPEDWLILLSLQVASEGWKVMKGWDKIIPLQKLCDLAALIRVYQTLEWKSFLEQIKNRGIERVLFSALLLVHEVLETILPEEVMHRIQSDPVVRFYVRHMHRYLYADLNHWRKSRPNALEVHLFETYTQYRMREYPRDGVSHTISHLWQRFCLIWQPVWIFLHLAINPTSGDYAVLPLPHPLHFLYYLIRPIRLLSKYGLNALTGSWSKWRT
jgi:hypothetical protein